MATRYDLVTSRQDKTGKWRSHRIGVMFPGKDGGDSYTIRLDSLPIPNEKGEVWVKAWPPREDGDAPNARPGGPSGGVSSGRAPADLDDEIPF